ncbi:hypothetical protein AZSI13_32460 [Azospira sp. I13]|uniref:hypothetical protein n=1 Tax=Azospira sp. I13 TaxID=1765050 RepID=UPI000D4A26C7|nr:hypothetical protein [Azospira sp. I13]GBG03919.1 hypothetical protein AZSI13_32460 [Azospira sp. I13]
MADYFKELGLESSASYAEFSRQCEQQLKDLQRSFVFDKDESALKRIDLITKIRDEITSQEVLSRYAEGLEKNKKDNALMAKTIGLLFVGAIVGTWGIIGLSKLSRDIKPDKIGAFTACQELVRMRLKAPSTADFASYSESTVIEDDRYFRVTSYVDAQNAFGAKLRNRWVCHVQAKKETWQLIDLEFPAL